MSPYAKLLEVARFAPLAVVSTYAAACTVGLPGACAAESLRDMGFFLAGFIVASSIPSSLVSVFVSKIQALWITVIAIAPHTLDLLPLVPVMIPHLPKMAMHIEQLGRLMPATMAQKKYILPVFPEILEQFDVMLPLLEAFDDDAVKALSPHARILLDNIDKLVPHVDALIPYLHDLVPVLQVRGVLETVLPHLDEIVPLLPHIAPHIPRLIELNGVDQLIEFFPIIIKYIDTLGDPASLDKTIVVIDRLLPLLPLLPLVDVTGILHSRLAVRAMPTFARFLPRQTIPDPKLPLSPQCEELAEKAVAFQVPGTSQSDGFVFYTIVLNGVFTRSLRYSELCQLHRDIKKEAATYTKINLLPFPNKSTFGKALSKSGLERRRISIENYLERVADFSSYLILDSKVFRDFIRSFGEDGALKAVENI